MKMRMLFIGLGILMGISVVFYSCSNTNNPVATTGGSGIMKINMIDAPANFTTVNIKIDSVQAHISTADNNSGWTTLNNLPTNYDLSLLVNGNSAVIAEDTLPAGNYSQIRLYLDTTFMANYVILEGQTQPLSLTTPSGTQSGIKLNVDATIQAGITYELTIDFNVAQSIVTTGSPTSPKYILKPVLNIVTTAKTGIISGTINPADAAATITATLTTDNTKVYSTSTDNNGDFKLIGLPPGTYDVEISAAGYNDETFDGKVVTAGSTTALGTIDLTTQGISGTVSPIDVIATITATLTTDNTKIYTVNTNGSDGLFNLYLPPGTYDVVISATGYNDETFDGEVISTGSTTDLGTVTLTTP